MPELLGGSADLTGSNNTNHKGSKAVTADDVGGNYLHYGVREFGMTAIMNGIALHGGFIPYGGTFLVFSDYARNAVRMAALMKQRVILVYTHDSIGLGEDGPTHQPVEHVASLRLIPNMRVWRPCDTVETAVAWADADRAPRRADQPDPDAGRRCRRWRARAAQIADIARGGYVLVDCEGTPELRADRDGLRGRARRRGREGAGGAGAARARRLDAVHRACSTRRTQQYRDSVLPPGVHARGHRGRRRRDGWWRYVGLRRRRHRHGHASAPRRRPRSCSSISASRATT